MGTEKGDPAQTVNDQRFAKPRLDGDPANLPVQSGGVSLAGSVGQEVPPSEMLCVVTPVTCAVQSLGTSPTPTSPSEAKGVLG